MIEIIRYAKRRGIAILLGGLLGGILGATYVFSVGESYSASATLIVNPARPEAAVEIGQLADAISKRMDSYRTVGQTNAVIDPAVQRLGVKYTRDDVRQGLGITVPVGTSVLNVSATAHEPDRSMAIVNAVAGSLTTQITGLAPTQPGGSPSVNVLSLQTADTAQVKRANPTSWLLGGTLLGGIAGDSVARAVRNRRSQKAASSVIPMRNSDQQNQL